MSKPLTPAATIEKMRQLVRQGYSRATIAARFNLHLSTVSKHTRHIKIQK